MEPMLLVFFEIWWQAKGAKGTELSADPDHLSSLRSMFRSMLTLKSYVIWLKSGVGSSEATSDPPTLFFVFGNKMKKIKLGPIRAAQAIPSGQ